MELDECIEKVGVLLQQQPDVVFAYFYGSRATGFARKNSDLDIAVFLDQKKSPPAPYGRGVNLSCQLDELTQPVSVDVRELNSASPFFCFQVLKTGRLLFSRNEDDRVEFENKTRNKYFDLKIMYKEFYQDMINRLKGGTFGAGPKSAG